ncbi:MAG: hypothetical protein ILP19_02695, partial [Oscillospiraceae bacterium]|nr:hypothetical protein [Oscillospiraceae bacterium]
MPKYPERTGISADKYKELHEEWEAAVEKQRSLPEGYSDCFDDFFIRSTKTFVKDTGDNVVFSPLSLYIALGINAEITDGQTRPQILDALGQPEIESLRTNTRTLWNTNFIDDGVSRCVFANSLWANDKFNYNDGIFDLLARNYYTSSFSGDPASDAYSAMLRDWLNKQTDGMLSGDVENIRMDPLMVLDIVSTINYSGRWEDKFNEDLTAEDVFRSPSGDIKCDFLNGTKEIGYYDGKGYTVVVLPLENNGEMRLILPDEGLSPADLFGMEAAVGTDAIGWEPCECGFPYGKMKLDLDVMSYMTMPSGALTHNVYADLSVPEFDVSSHTDLIEGMKEMGITDDFDDSISDFSPLSESDGLYIGQALQDARTTIDENGCKAVGYTMVEVACNGASVIMNIGEIKFDRPFIFEIMSETDTPLFVGVVNDPV